MTNHIPGLMGLISAAVAPVVLISAVAILYSALTAKHSHLSDQVRQITAEFRTRTIDDVRRHSIRDQIIVFERRMVALWLATTLLSISLLAFVVTVMFVIWSQRTIRIGVFGVAAMLVGLVCVAASLTAELYETVLARASFRIEVQDIDLG